MCVIITGFCKMIYIIFVKEDRFVNTQPNLLSFFDKARENPRSEILGLVPGGEIPTAEIGSEILVVGLKVRISQPDWK